MTLFLIAISTALFTFLGGFFSLRFKDKTHLITGFSAGAVIGVAFFDLLPEALDISSMYPILFVTGVVALGFILYLILDRMFVLHSHTDNTCLENIEHNHEHSNRGTLRASSLSFHSFLDGLGIGLAFKVSPVLGAVVAVAVLAHDFSDGINTVTAIFKAGGNKKQAMRWLLVNAFTPVLGIILSVFITVQESTLGLVLALFAGFFLYIGASDLVPESYHAHPTKWTTIATILGVAFIFIVINLAQ
ncbi:ZIP family metal transporter [Candidatus Nomurabacteria bacterium]|nr:ZIP family metal transporter [Candidatus Nomurabacteria bacterium]